MEVNQHFYDNLDVIRERYVEATYLLEKAAREEKPFWGEEPSTGPGGEPTAYIELNEEEIALIEPLENPREVAFNKIEQLPDKCSVVIMGVGLGYTLEAINERIINNQGDDPFQQIIIIERDPIMMARALCCCNLKRLLQRMGTELVVSYVPWSFKLRLNPETTAVIRNQTLTGRDEEYYTVAFASLSKKEFRVLPLKQKERYNIILICEDSLRKDRLTFFGADPKSIPIPRIEEAFKDQFALEAVTVSTWTPTVIASILSGLMPWEHGLVSEILSKKGTETFTRPNKPFSSPCIHLAKQDRLKTYLSGNAWIHPMFGFQHGFNMNLNTVAKKGYFGKVMNQSIEMFMDSLKKSCFFLLMHYMDTHQPFMYEEDNTVDISKIRANTATDPRRDPIYKRDFAEEVWAYDSSVLAADRYVGKFFEMLDDRDILDNSLIAFFGDHGEELREHGRISWPRHGMTLYNEALNVPLLIRVPEELKPHFREQMARFPNRKFHLMHMIPLLEATAGKKEFDPAWFSETFFSFTAFHTRMGSVIDKDMKYLCNMKEHTEELYDLAIDPLEKNNIAAGHDEAERLRRLLFQNIPEDYTGPNERVNMELDNKEVQEIQNHLQQLGYM